MTLQLCMYVVHRSRSAWKQALSMLAVALLSAPAHAIIPIGCDPGMTKAVAAAIYPNDPAYVEFCPGAPGGHCAGTLPAGSCTYTLPMYDLPESLGRIMNASARDKLFSWTTDENGRLVAQIIIDSSQFTSTATANNYAGLQQNTDIPGGYYGLTLSNSTQTPFVTAFDSAEIAFRAKICPHGQDPYFSTLMYYIGFNSPQYQKAITLAFHFGYSWTGDNTPAIFESAYASQGEVMRRLGLPNEQAQPFDNTIFIDAHRFGLLPMPMNNSVITIDHSENCSLPMSSIPWRTVVFPVQHILQGLEAQGLLQAPWQSFRFVGGTPCGAETWGRLIHETQCKEHYLKTSTDTSPPPPGKFRSIKGAIAYSNGVSVCYYVNMSHAQITSADQITRIVPAVNLAWSPIWCPGVNTITPWDP